MNERAEGNERAPVSTADRANGYRRRLLDGLHAAIDERGLAESTVADIVRHARTSRRTFYEHFADRTDCFLALVERHHDQLRQDVRAAAGRASSPHARFREAMRAVCASLARRPALSVSAIREAPALGVAARTRQRRARDTTADALVALVEVDAATPRGHMLGRLAIGGVREIVATALEEGEDLPALADELASAVERVLEVAPTT